MSKDLIYGGICPVCEEEFYPGLQDLEDKQGESIENVKICLTNPPKSAIIHIPENE
jgi:hypothetical protein